MTYFDVGDMQTALTPGRQPYSHTRYKDYALILSHFPCGIPSSFQSPIA
jgi:hypothetical protein